MSSTAVIASPVRTGWRRPLVGAAIVWVVVRVVLVVDAVLAHVGAGDGFLNTPGWLFRLFAQWDSAYFDGIARSGYVGQPSIWQAFFPGYPAAARAVATLLGGLHPTAQQLAAALWTVSAVASLVAATLLWRLVEERYGPRIAAAATVLLLAGPYGFILAGLASFTRINGVFLAISLAALLVTVLLRHGRPFVVRTIAMLAIAVSGVLAYFGYLYAITGNVLAWSHAESAGWQRSFEWPWKTYYHTLLIVGVAPPDQKLQFSLDLVFALLLLLAIMMLARRRQWPEVVYLALAALSLMTSSDLQSLARNTLTLFPLVILVASTLRMPGRRWVFWVIALLGFALLIINAHLFTLGFWAD
jgi:hypothetical protein